MATVKPKTTEIVGTIETINPTETVSPTFTKKEFTVVDNTNEQLSW